jgi:hypothetical protein
MISLNSKKAAQTINIKQSAKRSVNNNKQPRSINSKQHKIANNKQQQQQ